MKPNVPQDSVNQHSPCINAYKMSPVIPISSPSTVTNSWSMTSSPMQSISDMHSFGMVPHNIPSSSYSAGFQPDMSAYQTPTGNMALRNRVRNELAVYFSRKKYRLSTKPHSDSLSLVIVKNNQSG